jgi:hypothetical protein
MLELPQHLITLLLLVAVQEVVTLWVAGEVQAAIVLLGTPKLVEEEGQAKLGLLQLLLVTP